MKQIIKYKSDDGCEFETAGECSGYEIFLSEINALEVQYLGQRLKDDGCSFANGGGYLQHNHEAIKQMRDAFMALVFRLNQSFKPYSFEMIGRMLDDSSSPQARAQSRLWHRLYCIDQNSREWGQPFYALNPSKGNQIRLN